MRCGTGPRLKRVEVAPVLTRSSTRFDPTLSSMRDLVLLILVAAASAAFVASSYVGLRIAAGLLPAKDFMAATLRYWIGDAS